MTDHSQSTRVCPGCGREISTVHIFCPYCGKPRGSAVFGGQPGPNTPPGEHLCPGCGRMIPEGLNFCPYCGRPRPSGPSIGEPIAQQKRLCPGCGREIAERLAFCPYCGRPGPSGPIPPRAETILADQMNTNSPAVPTAEPKVTCISCGKEVPNGFNFCPMCGKTAPFARSSSVEGKDAELKTQKCFGCDRDIPVGLNFCPYCGRPGQLARPLKLLQWLKAFRSKLTIR